MKKVVRGKLFRRKSRKHGSTLLGLEILNELDHEEFMPTWFCRSGWAQTIASQYWNAKVEIRESSRLEVPLGEAGKLLLVHYEPEIQLKNPAVIQLVHGLNGSFESNYIQRFAKQFHDAGHHVYAVNLRNCGPGLGLSNTPYNACQSEDLNAVHKKLRVLHPELPFVLIGFSLGGNLSLKALSENNWPNTLGVAVSPPADLVGSARKLSLPQNRTFNRVFSVRTLSQYQEMQPYLKGTIPPWRKYEYLRELDDQITAPLGGFRDADDYYEQSSALPRMENLKTNTLVLTSLDDPVVDSECFLTEQFPDSLEIILTTSGGHVAFLHRKKAIRRFMDRVVFRWVTKRLNEGLKT